MSNMVIQTNVLALNSHRNAKIVGTMQSKASARLSSGYKINSAADDAAGLAISEKMRSQIRGLDMASKNTQDAISLIQTAEGGMQEIDNMLQRIRELVVQNSNDTNENNNAGTGDRQKIQDEINQLTAEIDSMAERVEFNKKRVIDGSFMDTRAQLSTASIELNDANLQRSMASAKVNALNTALATANGDLDTAQGLLDAGVTTFEGETDTYITAEVAFNQSRDEYNASITSLQQVLDECSLADVSMVTADMLDDTKDDYIGAEKATKLEAALDRYAAAADDYGLDGLDLKSVTAYTGTKPTVTNDASAALDGARETWNDAKAVYAAAQGVYDGLVQDRDVEQQKVTRLEGDISIAMKDVKKSNAATAASTLKYDAAQNADANSSARPLYFQVGANAQQGLLMSIGSVKTDVLGIGDGKGTSSLNMVRNSGFDTTAVLDTLDKALSYVTTERSKLGAAQNRLEYTQKSLDISSENISAAESRIRDTDMAKEMMNLTKANVLQQAATAMLAQANQAPQSVLQLLR